MSKATHIPQLNFTSIERDNHRANWDLKYLLYKGGSKAHSSKVKTQIETGKLGKPIISRIEAVTKIHQAIYDKLIAGGSAFTADNQIRFIRSMFVWAEESKIDITLESLQKVFITWADSLVHQYQVKKSISQRSAYTMGSSVAYILDEILDRPIPLLSLTRLRLPPQRKTAQGIHAEKQNLADTFSFGHFLQDVCDSLTVENVLKGSLPIKIPLRSGGYLIEYSGTTVRRGTLSPQSKWEADGTLRTRYPLSNRRCEAELLMFIAQTGMNFSQAHKLKLRNFSYASHLDGYIVRERKARRSGDVLFEIFKEYKPHFERYLEWRRTLFPNTDLLFPFVQIGGIKFQKFPQFSFRYKCKDLGIPFIPPQQLRNTRINWLLRRNNDPDQTSEMAQHTKETLLGVYERPSQQRAMTEVTRFWSQYDLTINRTTPPAPGGCTGSPVHIKDAQSNGIKPDCIRPSGCLWCEHHRDIDSENYLWSLASFKHLKIIELSKWNPPQNTRETHPSQFVINRIADKLTWFRDSSEIRKNWVEEVLARIDEGNYHPDWLRRIISIEGI